MANRGHSKISALPESIRQLVDAKLMHGYTYEDVTTYLQNMGHDVSKSGVGRYGQQYLRKFEAVRMAKDYARLLSEDNVDRPTTELHEANNAIISQSIMETLVDPNATTEDKAAAAKSIATLQRAQVQNERLKLESRKAAGIIRTAMNRIKTGVFAELGEKYPDIAERIVQIAESVADENG